MTSATRATRTDKKGAHSAGTCLVCRTIRTSGRAARLAADRRGRLLQSECSCTHPACRVLQKQHLRIHITSPASPDDATLTVFDLAGGFSTPQKLTNAFDQQRQAASHAGVPGRQQATVGVAREGTTRSAVPGEPTRALS